MIAASIETSDGEIVVSLDASAWFEQASDAQIRDLISEGLRGLPGSAAQPLFSFYRDSAAKEVWTYWAGHKDRYSDDPVRWHVTVDAASLAEWLSEHRPRIAPPEIEGSSQGLLPRS